MSQEPRHWICSTIDTARGKRASQLPPPNALEGVAKRGSLWPADSVLRVRFMGGEPALHTRVLAAARRWLVSGVRLAIEPAAMAQAAQIRVAFVEGAGSWSQVGTDALTVHPSQPTMNLGWVSMATPDVDFDSVVIHEFGHALGLLHEHNHPKAKVRWNKAAVNADLSGRPNFWSQETIDFNVYQVFDLSQVITTDFDKASVMIYTIPPHWTLDGQGFTPLPRLSEGDVATIRRLYR